MHINKDTLEFFMWGYTGGALILYVGILYALFSLLSILLFLIALDSPRNS